MPRTRGDNFNFSKFVGWVLVLGMIVPAIIGLVMSCIPETSIRLIGLGIFFLFSGFCYKLFDFADDLRKGREQLEWSHAGMAGMSVGRGIWRFIGGFASGVILTIMVSFLVQGVIMGSAAFDRSSRYNNFTPSPWKKGTGARIIDAVDKGASFGMSDRLGLVAFSPVVGLFFGIGALLKGNSKQH